MNIASSLLGLLLIPLAGLIIDQFTWKHGMSNIVANSSTFLAAVIANTIIEGFAVQRVFDRQFGSREYIGLFVATACSTGVISAAMALQARPGLAEYYPRFGFSHAGKHGLACQWGDVPDEVFMVRFLKKDYDGVVNGAVKYSKEFNDAV